MSGYRLPSELPERVEQFQSNLINEDILANPREAIFIF